MSINHPEQHPLDGKLEPDVKECFDQRAPLYSIAISLKRIADALTGDERLMGIQDAVACIADRMPGPYSS